MDHIIFDFDGTIADSLEEVIGIYNAIAGDYHLRKLDQEIIPIFRQLSAKEFLKCMKVPLRKISLIGLKVNSELQKKIPELKIFPYLKEVLHTLNEKNKKLYILSSNSEENIRLFLKKNELEIFQRLFSGVSIFGKAQKIKLLMKKYHMKKENAVYVGDEARDIEAAKKAGIPIISVSWGYNTKETLEKLKPEYLVDDPGELLEVVNHNI